MELTPVEESSIEELDNTPPVMTDTFKTVVRLNNPHMQLMPSEAIFTDVNTALLTIPTTNFNLEAISKTISESQSSLAYAKVIQCPHCCFA